MLQRFRRNRGDSMNRRWVIVVAALAVGAGSVAIIGRGRASRQVPSASASPLPGRPSNDRETGDLYVLSIGVEPNLTAAGKRDPYAGDARFVREALARAEPLY